MDVSEPENLGFCHQRLNRIEPKLKAYIDNGDIVGISTLVARRGQVVHRSLIGLMNSKIDTPISMNAIFFYTLCMRICGRFRCLKINFQKGVLTSAFKSLI